MQSVRSKNSCSLNPLSRDEARFCPGKIEMSDIEKYPLEGNMGKSRSDQLLRELRTLQEKVKEQGYALRKWGRMLNALIALLEERGIVTKDEALIKVYERLKDSGALERGDDWGEE